MKSQRKPREKAVQNPQNQLCDDLCKKMQTELFCDFVTKFSHRVLRLYVAAADLTVRKWVFWGL